MRWRRNSKKCQKKRPSNASPLSRFRDPQEKKESMAPRDKETTTLGNSIFVMLGATISQQDGFRCRRGTINMSCCGNLSATSEEPRSCCQRNRNQPIRYKISNRIFHSFQFHSAVRLTCPVVRCSKNSPHGAKRIPWEPKCWRGTFFKI